MLSKTTYEDVLAYDIESLENIESLIMIAEHYISTGRTSEGLDSVGKSLRKLRSFLTIQRQRT